MPCRRWSERAETARLSPEIIISRFDPGSTQVHAYDRLMGKLRARQLDSEIGIRNPKNKKRKTGQMAINSLWNHLSIPTSPPDRVPGISTTLNCRQCIYPAELFLLLAA
jgi:hypothetical protein